MRNPRLQIVVVGPVRPPHADSAHEYERRVNERVGLRVDEVASEPLQRGGDQVLRREAERVRRRVLEGAYVVALVPDGRAPASSEAFASWCSVRLDDPRPTVFLIGGAMGLDPEITRGADERLSLGPLTLPHQLARVVLVEQLFRALAAIAGHPYAH